MTSNKYSSNKNQRKNLIFFTDSINTGGAEEYLKILAVGLSKEFNVRVAIPKNKGTEIFVNELISKGVEVDFIGRFNFINNFLYFRKNKPDYIHFNLPYPTGFCTGAIFSGVIYSKSKLYVTEHLAPPEYKPLPIYKLIKRIIYAKIDLAITVSAKNKDVLIKNFNLPKNKIKVVYNSINIDYIKNYNNETVQELKNKFTISESAIVFGTVGRLDRQKGHDYLINASKNVIRKVPEAIFLIVGRGKLKHQIRQKIKDNNIEKNFRLVGYQKDLPEIHALIDIFVLPSISEGFPFVLLEAMAAKKPVIATNVGGVSEIIMNYVNGIFVEPMDSEALSKAMLILATDKKKRTDFAEMGYNTVVLNFTLEKMISATKEIYN
ncbi:MAG: glycosyltransferase family 4 protein [Candidatus Methanoperedens sp.]|nr:glycosyltransferase family 4 protein [Candidatus Methanoperedens sp.]